MSAAGGFMNDATEWESFALTKLTRVLGTAAGEKALRNAMIEAKLPRIATADDLYALAQVLNRGQGVVAAVGGMLGLHAVMNGAMSTAK